MADQLLRDQEPTAAAWDALFRRWWSCRVAAKAARLAMMPAAVSTRIRSSVTRHQGPADGR